MKSKYTTPVITIEELLKQDVLLASGDDIDPSKKDDQNVSGMSLLSFVWNGEFIGS